MEMPNTLFRYRPDNDYTLESLRESYLWFSKLEDYNDPFDGQLSFRLSYSYDEIFRHCYDLNDKQGFPLSLDKISETAWQWANGVVDITSVMTQTVAEITDKVRTCCFTAKNNNILMWSHYANSHKGICLEFDLSKDIDTFYHLIPMRYVEDYTEHSHFGNTMEQIRCFVRNKFLDWQYEDEYRVFNYPETRNKIPYNPSALKTVIFGCKSTPEFIKKVKEALVDKPEVTFKRCELDTKSYKLIIKNIN